MCHRPLLAVDGAPAASRPRTRDPRGQSSRVRQQQDVSRAFSGHQRVPRHGARCPIVPTSSSWRAALFYWSWLRGHSANVPSLHPKSRVEVSEPPRSQRGRAGLVHGCSVVQQCPFAVCRLPHRARSFCAASRCRSCRRPDHGWLRARSEPSWSSKTPLPSRLLPPDRWWV